jgi:succinate dehydrogenase/fumarate reductase-like Fe-S protein
VTKKLFAWLNLAWHFAGQITTRTWLRPFRRGRDRKRFYDAVSPEGYLPLDPPARTEFVRYMNCVHCGLCALACDSSQQPMSAWDEAWTFVAGGARSLDRAQLVVQDLPACAQQPAAQAVCPTGVPINNMAGAFQRMVQ